MAGGVLKARVGYWLDIRPPLDDTELANPSAFGCISVDNALNIESKVPGPRSYFTNAFGKGPAPEAFKQLGMVLIVGDGDGRFRLDERFHRDGDRGGGRDSNNCY